MLQGAGILASFMLGRAAADSCCSVFRVPFRARGHLWHLATSAYMVARLAFVFRSRRDALSTCPATGQARDAVLDEYILLEFGRHGAGLLRDAADPSGAEGDMFAPHVLSVLLSLFALASNATCFGVGIVPYIAITNPLQHLSKVLHVAFPGSRAASASSAAFVAAFFVLRVVLYPLCFARPVVLGLAHRMPPATHRVAAATIVASYVMQLFWFRQVLVHAREHVLRTLN